MAAAEATAPAADHAGDAGDNDTALPAPAAALPPNEEPESKQLINVSVFEEP